VLITAEIVTTSTTAASVQNTLLTTLSSADAASIALGITVEDQPTVELASPPPPPLTPPSPLPPLRPPPAPKENSGNLEKDPDVNGSLEDSLTAAGIAAAAVLMACCCLFIQRTRRLKKKDALLTQTTEGPTFVASVQDSSDFYSALKLGFRGDADAAKVLLDGTAHQRAGSSWYRPITVQLLAAPKHDGTPDAPPWSALVVDGVTVPYEEVAGVRMDESALEFIVEQKPRTFATTGVIGGSPRQHLRMYSRSEFDLWREALYPKITNPDLRTDKTSTFEAARKWITNSERTVEAEISEGHPGGKAPSRANAEVAEELACGSSSEPQSSHALDPPKGVDTGGAEAKPVLLHRI